MSRPIQALAPGFLGLLGLKQGNLPVELTEDVKPILEMFDFYALGARETIPTAGTAVQNISAVAHFAIPELTVPAGQVWYVHGFTIQVTVPVAEAITVVAQHFNPSTTPIHASPPTRQDAAVGGAGIMELTIGGFLASAGDLFGVLVSQVTGVGLTLRGACTFSRFIA